MNQAATMAATKPSLAALIARSHRQHEDWRYTDIEKLTNGARQKFASSPKTSLSLPCLLPETSHPRIVFINGEFKPEKSIFSSLPASILQGDAEQGYRLNLPEKSCLVTVPIELIFIHEANGETGVRLSIEIGANASTTLVEQHVAHGPSVAANIVETDIRLGSQAKLIHRKIIHDLAGTPHFARCEARVAEGAYYRSLILVKDARLLRQETDVALEGELAQCELHGIMLLRRKDHADIHTRVRHATLHSTSRQLIKAVVKDQARGVFQGRIEVAEGAQKTDGQQLCRALLLSDQAEMDAKPELEIFADDVSCSHGCAVGDLDAAAMFYLRSRGLGENEAKALLLRGFIAEVIDTMQTEETRAYIRDLAEGWFNAQD